MIMAKLKRLPSLERFKDELYMRYRYASDADIWLCIFTALEYMTNVAKRLEYKRLYDKVAKTLADSFFTIAIFDNIQELKFFMDCSSFEHAEQALKKHYEKYEYKLVEAYYDETIIKRLIDECKEAIIPAKPYRFDELLATLKQMKVMNSAIIEYIGTDNPMQMKKMYFAFALALHGNLHENIARWMLYYRDVSNTTFVEGCYDLDHYTAPWLDVVCPRISELRTLLELRREGNLRELLRYASRKIREILIRRDEYLDELERMYFKVIPEVRREIGFLRL